MSQAVVWNDNLKELAALDYNVAMMTYDPVDALAKFAARRRINY